MITLTLTEEQAETLGYALSAARRFEMQKAREREENHQTDLAGASRERARRIEELRVMLDTAPETA